jgi:hypothetical protein
LTGIVTKLQNKLTYHSSKFVETECVLVDKLLSWPGPQMGGVMNLLRMCVLHPEFAKQYSTRKIQSSTDEAVSLVEHVASIAQNAPKATIALLALRVLANTFGRRVIGKSTARHADVIVESTTAVLDNWPDHKSTRLSAVGLLINYAILFSESKDNTWAENKVLLISSVIDRVEGELAAKKNEPFIYRLLVVAGTLLYMDPGTTELCNDLDLSSVAASCKANFSADTGVSEIADEIINALAGPLKK